MSGRVIAVLTIAQNISSPKFVALTLNYKTDVKLTVLYFIEKAYNALKILERIHLRKTQKAYFINNNYYIVA